MEIKKRLELVNLYANYSSLLTAKQCSIFEMYYEDDYSITEICEILQITKNGVYNSLKQAENKLYKYEEQLKISANYEYNVQLLKKNQVANDIIDLLR